MDRNALIELGMACDKTLNDPTVVRIFNMLSGHFKDQIVMTTPLQAQEREVFYNQYLAINSVIGLMRDMAAKAKFEIERDALEAEDAEEELNSD